MATKLTATKAQASLLSLLDQVEAGQEIEITRRGRVIARLVLTARAVKWRSRWRVAKR